MPIIDFHNHFYPPRYLAALQKGPSAVRMSVDEEGNPCLHYPGDYNIAVRGHRDIAYRQKVLERERVDLQVLTLTTPGTHIETPTRAVELARMVNDDFAKIAAERSRFTALATLPLNDPDAATAELERAVRELGLPGAMVFSNVNGVALHDERFTTLWECANDLSALIHIHPTNPVNVDAMQEYWLMPLVGFLFDTTLAAAGLVFRGIPERFPRIRWILGHLGGAIPYIAERLDRGFYNFPECRTHINRPPSDYLKQFYYDAVNFDPRALELAVAFAGADHILAASDYPHQIGSLQLMKQNVASASMSEAQRESIWGRNARRLLESRSARTGGSVRE